MNAWQKSNHVSFGFSGSKLLRVLAFFVLCLSMTEKLPSQTFSSASLLAGAKVVQHQQVKIEPEQDTEAMEAELKDWFHFLGLQSC